jgi:hypothetical protein
MFCNFGGVVSTGYIGGEVGKVLRQYVGIRVV